MLLGLTTDELCEVILRRLLNTPNTSIDVCTQQLVCEIMRCIQSCTQYLAENKFRIFFRHTLIQMTNQSSGIPRDQKPLVTSANQKIIRIRREYNTWVADESLEDYSLRYTPHSFRKWSEWRVANTALGGVSFLALEAIGAVMALNYGFSNALWAILAVSLVAFLTGLPISYYAARYGVDIDLLTRGAGFGYVGSTITSLIYAAFTFIFFALEAAIMALALKLYLDWSIVWCYIISALVIIPLVLRGITLISKLQMWTQGLWIFLLVCPYVAIAYKDPGAFVAFTGLSGSLSGSSDFSWLMFGAAFTVACSLVVQIGEQVDYLRFLPEKTDKNRWKWWSAVLIAGPGWIIPGMAKMLGGAFLAFLVLQQEMTPLQASEPTRMYTAGFSYVFNDPVWIIAITVLFVVLSQVKINVTNAYAGSLAWSNFFARLTHSHPGRVVWLVFNVLIATLLMTLGVFHALEQVLGLYSNVAIAWIGAIVADLVINKPLGLSPKGIEFKRAYLYDINPVGLGATILAASLALLAYSGIFGEGAKAFAPLIALSASFISSPVLAWLTQGKWYMARRAAPMASAGTIVQCSVCENDFESPDMAHCPAYGAPICSLCCTLDSRCHDSCKQASRLDEQVAGWMEHILPKTLSERFKSRAGRFLMVFLSLSLVLATVMGIALIQENPLSSTGLDTQTNIFYKIFLMLIFVVAVCSWWVVLISESRNLAQEESNAQSRLLQREVETLRRTDAALQLAKDEAERANDAKTRYVAGMTHELRTPLNSILGYLQIILKENKLDLTQREALQTVQSSGVHMAGLVDDLLDLAHIESGRLRLETAAIPLPLLIDELVRMIRPQAQARGLIFEYEVQGVMSDWVKGDAKRLTQVLINLLGNAIKFTDHGKVTLRIDARAQVLLFKIEDTGVGIAAQDQQRIFLPFERGGAARRRGEPGTGLGLTITGLLTAMMGGDLSMTSTPGVGTIFTVRLYLPEAPDPGVMIRTLGPVSGYKGKRRTLLAVDDQPDQRQMLAALLNPLGFTVREAASGSECLESLNDELPDAILLDLSMDEMDGWQTARAIREQGFTKIPIIIVSANLFDNQPSKLQAALCQAFVAKPVLESELVGVLGRFLGLEWIATGLSGAELPEKFGPEALAMQEEIPDVLREKLVPLIRIGHVQGLLDALQEHAKHEPSHKLMIRQLREMVLRFDFESLLDLTKDRRED